MIECHTFDKETTFHNPIPQANSMEPTGVKTYLSMTFGPLDGDGETFQKGQQIKVFFGKVK